MNSNMEKRVKALYVYPVKSCRGIQVDAAALCETGLQWDRQWLIVNERGRMITQRVEPKLALIEPHIPPQFFTTPISRLLPTSSLCLKAPGMEALQVPLLGKATREKVNVTVWDWSGVALNEGAAAQEWLSRYLGKTYYLVRYDPVVTTRATDPAYANGYRAAFSDGFPFLIASQASLDELNSRLKERAVSMNRFRPNIVVDGCEPFAEDTWGTFTIGELTFHGVKICARCKVPTIDQETGEMGSEPSLTLQTFRKGDALCSVNSVKNQVFFGQNAVCEEFMKSSNTHLVVHAGDQVQVREIVQNLSV